NDSVAASATPNTSSRRSVARLLPNRITLLLLPNRCPRRCHRSHVGASTSSILAEQTRECCDNGHSREAGSWELVAPPRVVDLEASHDRHQLRRTDSKIAQRAWIDVLQMGNGAPLQIPQHRLADAAAGQGHQA